MGIPGAAARGQADPSADGGVAQCADAVSLLLSLINLGCLTLLYLAIALKLSAPMTLLVLALGGGLMLLQRRSLERTRKSGQSLDESVGEVYAATEEHLLNLKSVKAYNAEERDVRLFASSAARWRGTRETRRSTRPHRASGLKWVRWRRWAW